MVQMTKFIHISPIKLDFHEIVFAIVDDLIVLHQSQQQSVSIGCLW